MRPEESRRTDDTGSLGRKAVRAGGWTIALRAAEQVGALARTVILARLLTPDDFGTVALAVLIMGMLQVFTDLGMQSVLVVRRENSSEELNSAWTLTLIRNGALYVLLVLLSAPLSRYFDDPELASVVPILGLMLLLSALTNIGVVQFDRELDFRPRFRLHALPVFVDLVVAVSVALMMRTLWALVIGTLAGSLARLGLSYLLHSYRPRLQIKREALVSLFSLGKWFFAQGALVFLFLHIDDWVVGRVAGVAALGLYSVAYTLSQVATTEVTGVIGAVAFPLYARIRDDQQRVVSAYRSVVQLTSVAGTLLAAAVIIVGPALTRHILGETWHDMGMALRLLGVWGLFRSLGAPAGFLLSGIGRPGLTMTGLSGRLIVLSVLIYPFTSLWGITGAAGAVVLASALDAPLMVWVATKTIGMSLRSWAGAALPPLMAVSLAAVPSTLLIRMDDTLRGTILAGGVLLLTYLAVVVVLERLGLVDVRRIIRKALAN